MRPASTKPSPPGVTGIWARICAPQKASSDERGARARPDRRQRGEQRGVVEGPAPDGGQQRALPLRAEGLQDPVALAQQPLGQARERLRVAAQPVAHALDGAADPAQRRVEGEADGADDEERDEDHGADDRRLDEAVVDPAADDRRHGEDRQPEHRREDQQVRPRSGRRRRSRAARPPARACGTAAPPRPRRRRERSSTARCRRAARRSPGATSCARMATCCSAHRQASVASCSAGHRSQPARAELVEVLPGGEEVEQAREDEVQRDAVIASQMARCTRRLRGVGCASPRSMTCSTSARSSIARSTRSPTRARRRHRHGCDPPRRAGGDASPAWVIRRRPAASSASRARPRPRSAPR